MSTVIKVEYLSKQYRLGNVGTGSIAHDVNRAWYKLRGKEDPYLKIGESNDRTKKSDTDYIWALKDINFEVKQGQVLGIIGRNGAGKSTLLKILSRTTAPTTGKVKLKGRIASLLEVGTGFHPELSGRENIFLNGAILGMTKQEIKRNFDEIVDFAGVERYVDTPVKRYSSGMYVRLAFGVAAYLNSEILIVDEVLAVGDSEFQKKCLGKMKDISSTEGRTILFVSHNLGSILQLCPQAILLQNGEFVNYSTSNIIVDQYLSGVNKRSKEFYEFTDKNNIGFFTKAACKNNKGLIVDNFRFTENVNIDFYFTIIQKIPGMLIGIGIQDKFQHRVTTFVKDIKEISNSNGIYHASVQIPSSLIAPNSYSFVLALWNKNGTVYHLVDSVLNFTINDDGTELSLFEGNDYGSLYLEPIWSAL